MNKVTLIYIVSFIVVIVLFMNSLSQLKYLKGDPCEVCENRGNICTPRDEYRKNLRYGLFNLYNLSDITNETSEKD